MSCPQAMSRTFWAWTTVMMVMTTTTVIGRRDADVDADVVDALSLDAVVPSDRGTWSKKYTVRLDLAYRYVRGDGIEIGAKSAPLFSQKTFAIFYKKTQRRVTLRLVDELTTTELLVKYGGNDDWVKGLKEYPVDIVDDASTLATFQDESLDFIVANHVLEHVPDFLGTLDTFARKLRVGGIAFFALPDRRFNPEDKDRPTTSPNHHITAFRNKTFFAETHLTELAEGIAHHVPRGDVETRRFFNKAKAKMQRHSTSGIHLHTFTTDSIAATLSSAHDVNILRSMALIVIDQVANENIVLLRKVSGTCPGYYHADKPEPLPRQCPQRGTTQGKAYSSQ